MSGFKNGQLFYGCQRLLSSEITNCEDLGTYYKIGGTWGGHECRGFIRDGSGKLTYLSGGGCTFLFNGSSDVSVNKACRITYGLYKNGVLVSNAETPHDFSATSKIESLGITALADLNLGDYLEIYVKSSVDDTEITSTSLAITFLGTKA